jgi:hypothetical protein
MSASARVTSVRTARRRDPEHHFAPVIDYCPNIAEHMAYAEEKGSYSSPALKGLSQRLILARVL